MATCITCSMAISAIPAASAHSIKLDLDDETSVSMHGSGATVTESGSVHADADTPSRCKKFSGELLKNCTGIFDARNESTNKKGESHGDFVSKQHKSEHAVKTPADAEAKIITKLKRMFGDIAKMAKRACTNDNAATVQQCMNTIKGHIQAQVSAMIDAAFAIQ